MDTGVRKCSSFAGVIKVLYECGERVEFRRSSVPSTCQNNSTCVIEDIPSNKDFFGILS